MLDEKYRHASVNLTSALSSIKTDGNVEVRFTNVVPLQGLALIYTSLATLALIGPGGFS